MMLDERTRHESNFTCVHAGPMDDWAQFKMEPPDVPRPSKGKVFLQSLLGSRGMEMSLNVVPPGKGIPFLHRHKLNEEVYVFVGGKGQFLVDGECFDVQEGSVVRIGPAGARAFRNNSEAPLYFLCIQYRADSVIEGQTRDGQGVEGKPTWPDDSFGLSDTEITKADE
ncbi:MAG TPA: cupin domain-containing protein [Pirellulales bacterium]|nr:cupin domain-containing protein [Pirellulales bacterium]